MKIKEFKEKCPNLYKELKESPSISIDEIKGTKQKKKETKEKENEETYTTRFPSIVDHLLGCETDKEALEIIEYFEEKREINEKIIKKLKEQIKKNGVRSFGEKRKKGSIEKKGLDY